ncbi:hypothetical protein [Algirhabdus cladophorae]|uniref:hypothetical protein n=1 Tax=Algirhabdus cladophorae TaxID=3377108 RepID=UPI003B8485DF
MMNRYFKSFAAAEEGNVTVDWIVLLSGIVFLSVAVLATIANGADSVAERTGDDIDKVQVSETIG